MLMLPQDGHVHSQWSWDAPRGDMERTCARALEVGLTSLAFTDHVDLTPWALHGGGVPAGFRAHVRAGILVAEPLDVPGYLECVERCRELFPDLRILSGVEVSEPHLHEEAVAELVSSGRFDRVLGSVHSLVDLRPASDRPASEGPGGALTMGARVEIGATYAQRPALDVVGDYLAEVAIMANSSAPFSVLAHIDYPARSWPGVGRAVPARTGRRRVPPSIEGTGGVRPGARAQYPLTLPGAGRQMVARDGRRGGRVRERRP